MTFEEALREWERKQWRRAGEQLAIRLDRRRRTNLLRVYDAFGPAGLVGEAALVFHEIDPDVTARLTAGAVHELWKAAYEWAAAVVLDRQPGEPIYDFGSRLLEAELAEAFARGFVRIARTIVPARRD